jgi:hypothetical protein
VIPHRGPHTLARAGRTLGASTILIFLSVAGLLIIPTHCTCGSDLQHGHSLFQLPHHRHETVPAAVASHDHSARLETDAADDAICSMTASPKRADHTDLTPLAWDASSKIEFGDTDGATLRALPSSSHGQPMTLIASSIPDLSSSEGLCGAQREPATMRGLTVSPDPPPPRAETAI